MITQPEIKAHAEEHKKREAAISSLVARARYAETTRDALIEAINTADSYLGALGELATTPRRILRDALEETGCA